MEQFNLNTWLQDKSRKVITRDGRSVRILDYNIKGDKHICIAVDDEIQESITTVDEDGHCLRDKTGWHESNFDLFLAADEEKLTEFEKELQTIISEASHWTSEDGSISTYCQFGDKEIKKISTQVLDLARKELQPEFDKEMDKMLAETDKVVYQKGQQDALKDLPKWKKANVFVSDEFGLATRDDDLIITHNGYQIKLSDLKTLPKEE